MGSREDETIPVDWCTFPPVGHAIEGLQVAGAYAASDESLAVSLLLNSRTAIDLIACCPWLASLHTVDLDVLGDRFPGDAFDGIPPVWDWLHIGGYRNKESLDQFPQIGRFAAAADAHFQPRRVGTPPQRLTEWSLRLALPPEAQAAAAEIVGTSPGPVLAILPSGGGERAQYPSSGSWQIMIGELRRTFPDATIVLLGKSGGHRPSGLVGGELRALLDESGAVNGYDLPLLTQLSIVEQSGFLLSPHSGFGFAALAVGTPWLTLSGGAYFEYFHNGTPFWSLLPDTTRFPAFGNQRQVADDDGSGPRDAAMTRARIKETLPELPIAATSLLEGRRTYEESLQAYFPALLKALGGDPSRLGSWDQVHERILGLSCPTST
ncbi:MAG TPA: hypothetical protein VHX59_25650 [Mycobacteriales bacterium]|nr:hypothetical protein [Mycobacteriales bacterium]